MKTCAKGVCALLLTWQGNIPPLRDFGRILFLQRGSM